MAGREEPHFSLAGLKTALRHAALARAPLGAQDIADLCASFQEAVAGIVRDRTSRALDLYQERLGARAQKALVVAGGVAANQRLKAALEMLAAARGFRLVVPPPELLLGQCRHDRLGRRHAARAALPMISRPRSRPLAARPRRAPGHRRRGQGLSRTGFTLRPKLA